MANFEKAPYVGFQQCVKLSAFLVSNTEKSFAGLVRIVVYGQIIILDLFERFC